MPTQIMAGFVGVPFVEEEVMMAYDSQHVLAIIHNGAPVREINSKVFLPFRSEYKIRLKNKSTLRSKARVWIDGRKVSNLGDFILHPGETLDLERFLDESMSSGNRFKFVPLSDKRVNDPTDSDNGIVKVEFYQETVFKLDWNPKPPMWPLPYKRPPYGPSVYTQDTYITSNSLIGSSARCWTNDSHVLNSTSIVQESAAGATVEGSMSGQQFVEGDDFETQTFPITLTLKIRGRKSKTVSTTPNPRPQPRVRFCGECGDRRQRSDNFCRKCGWQFPVSRKR